MIRSKRSSPATPPTTGARARKSPVSRVQAVVIDPQDPAEATIRVGGRGVLRAAILDLDELGVRAGVAWSAVLKRRIEHAGAVRRARSAALELLADSPRGESALRRAIARQGRSPAVVNAVIVALREEGWLAPPAAPRRGRSPRRRTPS